MNPPIPSLAQLEAARARLGSLAHRTPVLTCTSLDRLAGARLFFKCENFQRTGSFKFRGAWNAVQSLEPADAARGVLTHSSGNHAAALACAAALRGVPAHIVMPRDTAAVKVRAVEHYGGRITFCEPKLADRVAVAERVQRETGAVLIHPYDDARVIAGQATVGWELLEQQPELDAIIAPVSGGGLLSGIALAVAALRPQTTVFGAEPKTVNDAAESLRMGRLQPATGGGTCADGLRAALSARTFAILRHHAREILCVSEAELVTAMRLIWERMKIAWSRRRPCHWRPCCGTPPGFKVGALGWCSAAGMWTWSTCLGRGRTPGIDRCVAERSAWAAMASVFPVTVESRPGRNPKSRLKK